MGSVSTTGIGESKAEESDGNLPTLVARSPRWRRQLERGIATTDLLIIAVVVVATQLAWLGTSAKLTPNVPYWAVSAALILGWAWALGLNNSRSHRLLGLGLTEYVAVVTASLRFFGAVAIVAYLLKADFARGFFLLSLPVGVAALLAGRFIWRKWLLGQRKRGRMSARVLVVGSERSVRHLEHEFARSPEAGFRVVGACLPTAAKMKTVAGTNIPVLGLVSDVSTALQWSQADTVAITSSDEVPVEQVKRISWALEAGKQHLVLAPSIIDVAGPRMHMRPVAGLPLIHVETPDFSKGQRFVKRLFDLVLSGIGILVLSPLVLAFVVLIRVTSRGPAFFMQQRVGRAGNLFRMVKFRSMVVDAEELLVDLRADQEGSLGNEVLFKLRNDPRVTRVGRFMRKFSIDELPQLFNVFVGTMSLIGPRPPLPSEVEQYAAHVHRRFLMKPGITGPWQVGGRSTLSWEESVRLDLSYVENWSLANDLMILVKTVKVVVAPGDSAH